MEPVNYILNKEAAEQKLQRMALELAEEFNGDDIPVVIIGIRNSGTVIAEKIGNPKAVRAVGTALGKNPFAPTIPCHRVVRADGGMGGYSASGGVATKRMLLQREGALSK